MPLSEITVFDEEHLFGALSNKHCGAEDVSENDVAQYLVRYLADIGATSIFIESEYIDSDYLDDVSAFYVKCFERYDGWCKRLHFFSGAVLDAEAFAKVALSGDTASVQNLSDRYLGFVVARPLPKAVVGRTVLKTYEPDNDRRHYHAVRPYKVNVFGIQLCIKSLAFQQQDRALAACATVALWSCFHKTAELFNTTAPSPASITRSAVRVVMSRAIPSKGLEIYQICDAIRDVGLEPEVYQPVPGLPIASLIYSYLKLGQPVLLGLDIQNIGLHAITVVGYSMQPQKCLQHEAGFGNDPKIPAMGERIDEFYAHDDGIGPFSRLKIVDPSQQDEHIHLLGSWKRLGVVAPMTIKAIIVPIYHKIRLGYVDILAWVKKLNEIMTLIMIDSPIWDIFLTDSNSYKSELRIMPDSEVPSASRILFAGHPRFIWCGRLKCSQGMVLEILFDATNIHGSLPAYEIRWGSTAAKTAVHSLMSNVDKTALQTILGRKLYDWLLENSA